MKTLGLLGGMTYSATAIYYDLINKRVQERFGARHSAPLFLYSVDQEIMLQYAVAGRWDEYAEVLIKAADTMKNGGADALVICACLAHKAANSIQSQVGLPVLHIADFVAQELLSRGIKRVGIFGTKIVMEDACVKGRLETQHGLEVLVPGKEERQIINRLVVEELTAGKVSEESKRYFIQCARDLIKQGAKGLILGSTDLGFIMRQDDFDVPLFNTAIIHAQGVADWAMGAE